MWEYSEKVKEHFLHPRNVGEVENPDGVGEVGSIACGDALKLTFKLDENGRIKEAKFQTFGCASAIAAASALTEIIKGLTLEEAEKITNRDIAEYLGGLPEKKMHCSVLCREALQAAIAYYRGETPPTETSPIVCECFGVTEKEIEDAIRANNLTTIEEITDYTKAGGGCGGCHEELMKILSRVLKEREIEKGKKGLTNIQRMKLVEEVLEKEIRPPLQHDGGDIDLIDIDGKTVKVALRGVCATCLASGTTLKNFVESKLRELVEEDIVVEEVK
ncbi:MAG: Fe-S cluster assembly protein NifU [Nitrospirae bacterium]|nr:MAG: Fe-S cluster assembly protein NifU [Nitrospirota bacterium]